MIQDFIQQFTDKKIETTKLENKYFLADKELIKLKETIKQTPYAIGLFLGEDTKKGFRPSPALLELIAKSSEKKIVVNKKAEWLFLCGRDIFSKSIVRKNTRKGVALIQNEIDEN